MARLNSTGLVNRMSPAHIPARLRFGDGGLDEHTRKKLQGNNGL